MLYHCKLIDDNGLIQESFFREGSSKQEVLETLDLFQWPQGYWEITAEDD